MAILGNNAAPGNGYFFDDAGNSQFSSGAYGMPTSGGYISEIHAYVNGHGGGANIYMAVWEWDTGNLKVNEWAAAPTGSVSNGGQSWMSVTGLNIWLPYHAGGYGIGFWSPNHVIWTAESGGATNFQRGVASGPVNFSGGGTEGPGALGAYCVYTALSAPTITSAAPSVGPAGSTVVLTGTNFLQATGITCCGVAVTSYTINSDTQITMTVPAGAVGAGTIVVTNPAGTGSIAFTAGTIWHGTGSAVQSIVAIWYGTGSGVAKAKNVWVPNGGGVKAVW